MRPLLAFAALAAPLSAQQAVAIDWAGSLYRLNPATGSGDRIGDTGLVGLNSLAAAPDGGYWSVLDEPSALVHIDGETAVATIVTLLDTSDLRGLTVDDQGELWALRDEAPYGDVVLHVDPASGATTPLTEAGIDGQSLAFGLGTFWVWNCPNGLYRYEGAADTWVDVDPATGGAGCKPGQALEFDRDDGLWGGWSALHTIDPFTGSWTEVGPPVFQDWRGIVVPQGATLTGDVDSVSASAGGTQTLFLEAFPEHAGLLYLLLGSASGMHPGTVFDGHAIPLNVDAYTIHTLLHPNQAPLTASLGVLDELATASAQVTVPPNTPSAAGLELAHAYLVLDLAGAPGVAHASNGVPLAIAK